jgi:outer membrane receptor protein involved in Fe transport
MERNFCKIIVFILVLIISLYHLQLLYAGTTGKIAGRIIDKDTKEPLIAINVVVEGALFGAATDVDGYYTILNVPPGTYQLKALAIGYADMIVNDVRVRIDQTSRIDFELTSEVVSGDTVVVVAERNIVREDVSTSVVAFQGEEVQELALTNINEVVELQAGIEDGLEIRGSQANEILFQIDGVTLRDPRNNNPISRVALSAVKEVSVEKGGFNAEYGHVRSGIINVVTKEGNTRNYEGSITVKASPPAAKHFGISPYNKNSMWMKSYLDPAVCWTGTENGSWDIYTQRQYPVFEGWDEVSRNLCEDDDPANDLTPKQAQRIFMWERRRRPVTNQPDYNIDAGLGGPVPFIGKDLGNLRFFASYRKQREMLLIPLSRDDYVDYDWTLQLTSDITPAIKLQLSGLMGKSYNVAINADDRQFHNASWGLNGTTIWLPTDYMRTPYEIAEITKESRVGRIFNNGWYSEAEVTHKSFAAKLTHILNQNTFYETSIEYFQRKYETGPIRDRDLTEKYEIFPDYFVDEAPYGYDFRPNTGIIGDFYGGHMSTARDSSSVSSTTFKIDLTSQVNFNNLVKTGFEFIYFDLNFDYGMINPSFGGVDYVKSNQYPLRAAFYLQDKLEALGFITNVGLRFDYSNANTSWVVVDPFNEGFLSSKYDPEAQYPSKDVKGELVISPRLGISHPITKNSKLFFNYGHFKQMPNYEEVFRIGLQA